jgi:hypothetical protein
MIKYPGRPRIKIKDSDQRRRDKSNFLILNLDLSGLPNTVCLFFNFLKP